MRLSARSPEEDPEFEVDPEVNKNVEPETRNKIQKKDADSAKMTFLLREDMEFCRKSLR